MRGQCSVEDDAKACGSPVVGNDMCSKHYQRWRKIHPRTAEDKRRRCVICDREFVSESGRAKTCSDECARQREQDMRKATDAVTDRGNCECDAPLDSHSVLGMCKNCYLRHRREHPETYRCRHGECQSPRVGDGLCSTHYQRQRNGQPLDIPERICEGCGKPFTPERYSDKFCTIPCGKRVAQRRRNGIAPQSVVRTCWWCDKPFESHDYRRKFCKGTCTRIAKSLWSLGKRYGITRDDYKTLWREQGGACAICHKPPRGNRVKVLCIDHDHETGHVRGLLCSNCNRAVGMLGDDPKTVRRAAEYLLAERQPRLFFAIE